MIECGEEYCGHSIDGYINVHGGITYASANYLGELSDERIELDCVYQPDAHDIWWFGFDCAHFMDLVPSMMNYSTTHYESNEYRSLEYVKAECADMARQFAKLDDVYQRVGPPGLELFLQMVEE